jgi:Ser/Thr protein kinase RdoA (MazF antagonist)
VLKVMHPARERSLLVLQCAALEHIAARAPDLTLPRVCRTREGATIAVADDGDAWRLVWMLTWVPGRPLAQARPHDAGLLAGVGRLLGELDRALLDFSHPEAERPELKWDLRTRAGSATRYPWSRTRGGACASSSPSRGSRRKVVPALPRLAAA